MRVFVTAENRFARTPDGTTWTPVQYARPFWDRYLKVFDEVIVVGRVADVNTVPADWLRVDGNGVAVQGLPYYEGAWQYAVRQRRFREAVISTLNAEGAVIFRVGSAIARIAQPVFRKSERPYAVEVISDPWDVFAPGSMRHPLRRYFRRAFSRSLRTICAGASSASYVTQFALQRSYPAGDGAFATYYSDVDLGPSAFVDVPKTPPEQDGPIRLICVGSLAQLYKASDVVVDAVAACARFGLDLHLTWIGDGHYRTPMEMRARDAGIADRVDFRGSLPPGEAVREALDQADLFLLVSRHEGLPRALIEAMARGLPCIGSTVGGISELLPSEDLVEPGNVEALVAKIRDTGTDRPRMAAMAARNLIKANEFETSVLEERQVAFLRKIRDQTAAWQAKQGGSPSRNHLRQAASN